MKHQLEAALRRQQMRPDRAAIATLVAACVVIAVAVSGIVAVFTG
jgi:hypothetical protein